MGISAAFKVLQDTELERLLEDHSYVETLLCQTDEATHELLDSFLSKVQTLGGEISNTDRQSLFTEVAAEIYDTSAQAGFVGLGKTWHALHFIVTGSLEPDGTVLGNFIQGGEPIGPNIGYETPRLISRDLVRQISKKLSEICLEDKYQSLDCSEENFACVYRGALLRNRAHMIDAFEKVKEMYANAATEGLAILAYLT